ncbi:hypothetical protein BJ973_005645 [Actinoplanes tereljensis]|uniref:Antitoxin n=1 Tax=Paractinoplanes tereljensis TaxID=571912 RepID=A0A919NX03_9ACTN|nr:hypothetical protein [Actinoplanes tereljensis]GIF26288.1 hypothetical protein Ate02nite_90180 [Actinoplanes tereljensis]
MEGGWNALTTDPDRAKVSACPISHRYCAGCDSAVRRYGEAGKGKVRQTPRPSTTAVPHTVGGMFSGMFSGMRTKTSLTLDEDSIPLARSRAEAEGLDVGRWLDRAIRHEAARGDIDVIVDWEASLPPDDQVVLAALDAADRHDLDAA